MEIFDRSDVSKLAEIRGQISVMVFCEKTDVPDDLLDEIQSYVGSAEKEDPNWISFAGKYGENCHDKFDEIDAATNMFAVTAWNIAEDDAVDYFIGTPGKRIFVLDEQDCSFQNYVLNDYKEQME